jgi:hypothetical protein
MDVSLFCPPGHLPEAFVSGLPLPGPSLIAPSDPGTTTEVAISMRLARSTAAPIRTLIRTLLMSPPFLAMTGIRAHCRVLRWARIFTTFGDVSIGGRVET